MIYIARRKKDNLFLSHNNYMIEDIEYARIYHKKSDIKASLTQARKRYWNQREDFEFESFDILEATIHIQ